MTDREYVRGVYREMLNYYYEHIGEISKYGRELITPRIIGNLTRRYLEIGGKLTSETNDIGWEGSEELWGL